MAASTRCAFASCVPWNIGLALCAPTNQPAFRRPECAEYPTNQPQPWAGGVQRFRVDWATTNPTKRTHRVHTPSHTHPCFTQCKCALVYCSPVRAGGPYLHFKYTPQARTAVHLRTYDSHVPCTCTGYEIVVSYFRRTFTCFLRTVI